jgi:hypothetical protein
MSDESTVTIQLVIAQLRLHPFRPVSGIELQMTAQATERQVRAAISALRRGGWLIVGNWSGYHIARDMAEVAGTVDEIMQQVHALQEIVTAMTEAAALRFNE